MNELTNNFQMYLNAIRKEANDILKPETNKELLAKNILYYLDLIEKNSNVKGGLIGCIKSQKRWLMNLTQ